LENKNLKLKLLNVNSQKNNILQRSEELLETIDKTLSSNIKQKQFDVVNK
jgi:hypothetical protein